MNGARFFIAYLLIATLSTTAGARTVYRCVRDGTVSLATAPEPGSRCEAKEIDDQAALLPNLWGSLGVLRGTLYQREQDGRIVYSTRKLPGSATLQAFTVKTPENEPAHLGLGPIGRAQIKPFAAQFRSAAKANGIEDAWLRAIAHAESYFDAAAVSPKGALGVMQLMPETAVEYGVVDPLSSRQSINAGAKHLRNLLRLYDDDYTLAAAAYNAGVGAVARYGGVPPYAETQAYVLKVDELRARYKAALKK